MPRKQLDGARLADDIARLASADKAAPPQTRPSLMDAVRQLSTFVETRATLRWSSAAIAAALTEAGYAIDAATLRSYRSRLRAKGGAAPVTAGEPPPPPRPLAASLPPPAWDERQAGNAPVHGHPPPAAPPPRQAAPTPPAPANTPAPRHFSINRSSVPSDRA